jgi:translation initiation factor 5B
VIGNLGKPIITKVRALFEPAPLAEMRDKKSKFTSVKQVFAATGVKIAAPDINEVVAGMPIMSADKNSLEKASEEVQKAVEEVIIETDKNGIVVKSDSLGSLEALIKLLKDENIQIKKATIGNINKKDISDAASNYESDPAYCAILAFNVTDKSDISDGRVKIISSKIIYEIIDMYKKWLEEEKKKREVGALDNLVQPVKIQLLKGFTFRQNNPAVSGVEILAGTLKAGTPVMNQLGKPLTVVKSIQLEKETVEKAEKKEQVAVSMPNITIGRQLNEGDILYSDMPEEQFRKFKQLKALLTEDQKMLLKEIAEIKRHDNPVWGI